MRGQGDFRSHAGDMRGGYGQMDSEDYENSFSSREDAGWESGRGTNWNQDRYGRRQMAGPSDMGPTSRWDQDLEKTNQQGGAAWGNREYSPQGGSYQRSQSSERQGSGMQGGSSRMQGRNSLGQFTGYGPKGYRRSDERINEDVCEALSQDPDLDASSIEVKVQSGQVTLSGSVEERDDKRLAEDLAEQVSGVQDVRNEIRVQRRESSQRNSDSSQQERGKSPSGTGSMKNAESKTA